MTNHKTRAAGSSTLNPFRAGGWAKGSLALLLALLALPLEAATSIDDLTGPWQLLVDDFPVASKTNLTRTYHPFQKYAGNPVLIADQPWEQPMVYLYGTVLPNETRTGYRMWYHTLRTNNNTCTNWSNELYATSTDGIHWVKPVLNLRATCGSSANNMYFTRPTSGGMTSVMQTPGDPDPAQLYKFMNYDSGGFYGAWSADGIHVTDAPNNPVFTGGSDVGQFCWDPHTQLYRGYVKNAYIDPNGLQHRAVALTTTTNITTWPHESLILWPDAFDDRWAPAGTIQRTHFYGLSAFAYESMYIGFLWIFRATDVDGYYVGPCFVELISSHDGVHWTREEGDRPALLPLGAAGAWDSGMIFTARAPIVEGDTIKAWYGGFNQVHGSALTKTVGSIGLATMRKDGFASLDAGATAGAVVTKPLAGAGGALQVNYSAAGGALRVEVLDQDSNVIPGYSQSDMAALSGNSVTQAVTWASHTLLPTGYPSLRLRFVLQNASLYSFMAGASVSVMQPPTISQQPVNQTVPPRGAAAFSIVADGTAPLSYRWQKNQLDLADGGHDSGCATAMLAITNADATDRAAYRCIVTNAYGSATSSPASLTVGQNSVGTVTLASIPTLSGDTANEARAITADGHWAVGASGSRGFLHAVGTTNVFSILSSDGAQSTNATGIGYRTRNGQQQIIVSGLAGGLFTAWMTTNGGTTWGAKYQTLGTGLKKPTIPAANGLAGTASDVFFSVWTDEGTGTSDNWGLNLGRFSNAWPASVTWGTKSAGKPDTLQMNGVSSNGRAVGWRRNGTTLAYANYVSDWQVAGSPWNFNALDGTTAGQALSISADGTIVFGMSPKGSATGTTNCGYKAVFAGPGPGLTAQVSINQLPNFPDTAGSLNLAVPYGCTPDGRFAVGMNYRSAEKAVLWDTSDANPAKWTVLDLTDIAAVNGILGPFARLSRAYSIGTNAAGALVIAGAGLDTNNPANTRAFIMTVAPPIAPIAFPPTLTISSVSPAGITCQFLSLANPGLTCYLEAATNIVPPVTWATVSSTPSIGGVTTLSDPSPSDRTRFYRVYIQ